MEKQPSVFLYYQIGGFRPNVSLQGVYHYDTQKLAEAIFGSKSSVELVLGIRPSGASSILLPVTEWVKREGLHQTGSPRLASDFLSLSPLQFDSVSHLAKKLTALKPKGKRRGEDDSAANKVFLGIIGQSGQFRSSFESNRSFFHALKPSFNAWKFGLSRSSLWVDAKVISFAFNEWSHEKGVILDIGWCSVDLHTHLPTFGNSVHLEIEERRNFGNRGKRKVEFRYGQTEVVKQNSVSIKVRDSLRCERPLILLVHDEGGLRTLFGDLGIDTAGWSSDLSSLLYDFRSESRGALRDQYNYQNSRRRSLSPRRDGGSRDQRRRSPPRAHMPVCVIDVRQMYLTLRGRITESNASLAAIATELGLSGDDQGTCAGNESRLLAEMWIAMASGLAIDEQYAARWGADAPASAPGGSGLSAALLDPSDADFDPNDLAPTGSTATTQPPQANQFKEWDDLDDEEEEYYGR